MSRRSWLGFIRCLEGVSSNAPSGQSISELNKNHNSKVVREVSAADERMKNILSQTATNRCKSQSRIDFLLKKEKIVIEAKMTSETLRDAKIGEQLIIDINRYQAHPDCQTLICFVYDPGHHLKNPEALENDLSSKQNDLTVKVIIYSPR